MIVEHPPVTHQHRFHVNPWLIAVIALSAALVAMGVYMLSDREEAATTPTVTQSPDVREVQTMLQDRQAAINAADPEALAAFYTTNAVLEDFAAGTDRIGADLIADYIAGVREAGALNRFNGEPIIIGDRYVLGTFTVYGEGKSADTGAVAGEVLELDANGKIAHEWVTPLQ
jgi:hypothetical protein